MDARERMLRSGVNGMLDANAIVGTHDVLWVTLDTLRYDVAEQANAAGRTPRLTRLLPRGRWEPRHSPASFTFAAHQAFFAGFFPTPLGPGPHPRPFALAFEGSETITSTTCVFAAENLPRGFASRGYHTICIGGVGFFNEATPLGRVLPSMFDERLWSPDFGVTCRASTQHQVDAALACLARLPPTRRVLLFLNVSALHQPNCIYSAGRDRDDCETMADALAYVDHHVGRLVDAMQARADLHCILTSDHGTAYGEDGYRGHRIAHPVVWTVPYAEAVLARRSAEAGT